MSDHNNNEKPSLLKRLLLLISFIKFSTYGVILLLHDLDILNQLKKCIFSSSSTSSSTNNNNNNNNQKMGGATTTPKTTLDKSDKSLELILNETIQDFQSCSNQNRRRRNSNSPQNNDKNESGENDGYYAIVTGANSGIGYETVKVLALNGINVIMACRSLERANQARERLESEMKSKCLTSPLLWNSSGGDGNGEKNCGGENREKKGDEKNEKNLSVGKLLVLQCDLGDLQSVKSFAQKVIQARYRVNLLINNAGVMLPPLELTKQGFETQFGSNFLAHFLLTHLMLDTLNRNGPSRIINVSSAAHWNGVIDWSNISPRSVHDYDPCFGYMQSKVCQIMSTYKLHRHLEEKSMSRNVTVNVLHPGIISSNINTNLPAWATFLQDLLVKRHSLNTFQGAITTLYLALSPEVGEVSGQYFARCMPVRSNAVSYDVTQQDRLWKISMEMIKDFL